ncbi:MAG TPA: DUF6328 family protein [Pedococcus sp.]|nr:DUF6328 family protein [Pedococcus sp.]
MDDYERTGETEAQKLDRNWDELLQELRVSQTGVQILTGFLLTLPLQPKFAELSDFQRGSYVVAISLSILATCLLITPVSMHRLLFRQRRKASLVRVGGFVAQAGLAILAMGTAAVATLIFGILFGERTGLLTGVFTLLVFGVAWLGLPLAMRRSGRSTGGP